MIIGSGPFWFWGHSGYGFGLFSVGIGGLVFVASIAAMFFVVLFSWVGSMRMSIYGRLSAGFQFGKIWSMVRHDFGGLLRILGMAIVLAIGIGVVVAVLAFVVVLVAFLVGVLATGGNLNINAPYLSGPVLGLTFAVGGVSILLSAVAGYGGMVVAVFTIMMVTRALGYWTAPVRRAGMARPRRSDAVRDARHLSAAAVRGIARSAAKAGSCGKRRCDAAGRASQWSGAGRASRPVGGAQAGLRACLEKSLAATGVGQPGPRIRLGCVLSRAARTTAT